MGWIRPHSMDEKHATRGSKSKIGPVAWLCLESPTFEGPNQILSYSDPITSNGLDDLIKVCLV